MKKNPIRKRRKPRIDIPGVSIAYNRAMWNPWYAVCPACGQDAGGGKTRKQAKDVLHHHRTQNAHRTCSAIQLIS